MSKQTLSNVQDGDLRLKMPHFECKVQRYNAKTQRWSQIDYRLIHMPLLEVWRLVKYDYDKNTHPQRRRDTTIANFTGTFEEVQAAALVHIKLTN